MAAVSAAIISDLHLGTVSGSDLLRRPPALEALGAALERVDELVILGDLLELREAPLAKVLADARPVLGELGRLLDGRRVTLLAGNHDHHLATSLLERPRLDAGAQLGLETIAGPPAEGPLAVVAEALGAPVRIAYPGVWLRPDVFATHGHYLDVHNSVPTLERLGAGLSRRIIGGLPAGRLTPADYESVLGPIYALTFSLAQSSEAGRRLVGGGTSATAWRRLGGPENHRPLSARLLGGVAVPGAVAVLNRAGIGPLKADLSAAELRRAGLRAIGEVAERLGLDPAWLVFGHTHRSGPHPGDRGWTLANGTRLINSGSWVYQRDFAGDTPLRSPYWPGTCVVVPDTGPPQLLRLLGEIPG
ncbi:MAG: hypothetical protein NVSMB25_05090 [Thermoleophilaceae bacterium]